MKGTVAALVVFAFLLVTAQASAQDCRGTKQWYAGKCRYPKEIEKLKKEAAARAAAERKRRQEAEQKRKEEEARKADKAACELARTADTVQGWKTYLKSHSGGMCLDEAIKRITELSGKPPDPVPEPTPDPNPVDPDPVPEPNPTQPDPTPGPVPPPPPKGDSGGGVSPLVPIGFSIGGAALLVGSIIGAIAAVEADYLDSVCPEFEEGEKVCGPDEAEDVDNMLTLAHTSTALFVLGGIGITVGIIGIFVGGGDDNEGRRGIDLPA